MNKPKCCYIYSPVQIAECGGPCEQGPEHCDCGELWITTPEPEGPTDEELDELFTKIDQSGEPESWRAYARAVLARWGKYSGSPDSSTPQPVLDPAAWMYQGEPSFDGTDWQDTWEVTTDKRLAEFKATPDQPIPLFFIQPQRQ